MTVASAAHGDVELSGYHRQMLGLIRAYKAFVTRTVRETILAP